MSPAPTSERPSKPAVSSKYDRIHKSELLPNPWNPNKMTGEMYAKALESIGTYGFIDPLLVRRVTTDVELNIYHYQIIDGEHRFRAGSDLGMNSFDSIIIDVDDATAKKLTVVMNELHGQADPHKMGDLLDEILQATSLESLLVGLPFDEAVLAGYLQTSLPDLPPLAASPPSVTEGAGQTTWVERLYRLPKEVALVVDEAIEKAKDGEEIEQWQGLERVAAEYLAS
jgi:ParB-like chromosome segregation protein Spo0J